MSKKSEPKDELCDWSKSDLKDNFDLLAKIVREPVFACTKCGRAANEKKWLCKPKKLPENEQSET